VGYFFAFFCTGNLVLISLFARTLPCKENLDAMETIKTASFEYLIDMAKENPEGGYTFVLDGTSYQIQDVLEISRIAAQHGYIVIY
jgi:hypothetical protein